MITKRAITTAALAAFFGPMTGCQTPSAKKESAQSVAAIRTLLGDADAQSAESLKHPPTSASADELARMAASEMQAWRRGGDGQGAPINVPVPPGVEPDALEPRRFGRQLANLSLAEALSVIATADVDEPSGGQPAREVEPAIDGATLDEALRSYARGRDEALQRRHLAAATHFLRALELTPNDTNILRELARSYLGLGNHGKAVQTYEQILAIDPDQSEALFMIALSAVDRREFDVAARMLGGRRITGDGFPHDEGAPLLADYVLAMSLAQLGYDRASIELSATVLDEIERSTITSMYGTRIASVYRQRGEVWRMIGDAHCRLGEFENALAAYDTSAGMPLADPDALAPRVLYANLRLGRVHMAQLELYAALSAKTPTAGSRLIGLCEYLREHGGDTQELARAVLALQSDNASDPSLVRAAAALLSRESATALLRNYVAQQPDNIDVIGELLHWLASDDVGAATNFAVMIVSEQMSGSLPPSRANASIEVVQQLSLAVPKPSDAVRAARRLPPTPSSAVVEARLLMLMGGLGPAWDVLERASSTWPENATIHTTRMELAGHLEEPGVLRRLIAEWTDALDASGMVLQSRSLRRAGLAELALEAAQSANDLRPGDATILTEIAWARLALGLYQLNDADQRLHAQDAVQYAEQALAIDRKNEQAYRALTTVYGPGGPLADAMKLRETASRLFEADPDSRLYAQLVAEETLTRRRYEQALERSLQLYETDASDSASLRMAVSAWRQMNRLEDAAQWLIRRIELRPGDPHLLEQWTAVQLWLGRPETALAALERQVASDPDDYAALRLLESTCIAAGRNERALELGEKRLLTRPAGVRRELELAGLYISTARHDDAVERLTFILDHVDGATPEQLNTAAGMAGRIDSAAAGRDELVLALTDAAVERVANLSADIYRSALVILAKRDPQSGAFEAFAQQMVSDVAQRDGGGVQAALLWQQIAQELVDVGQPWAASALVRMRILAKPELNDARAHSVLCTVTFVADAAAGERAPASIELLRELRDRGQLPMWPGVEVPAAYDTLLYEISQIYHIVGDLDGSIDILRELINVAPNHSMGLNNLGYIMIERNEVDDRVVRIVEMAHKLEPAESNVLDTIGWLRYKQSRFIDEHEADDAPDAMDGAADEPDTAIEYIERAIALDDSPSAEALDHLGDVLWRTGRTQEAARMWKRGLDVLEDPAWKADQLNTYEAIQSRIWWLVVVKPEVIYQRENGMIEDRLRRKLEAVDAQTPPPVAPTFEELGIQE